MDVDKVRLRVEVGEKRGHPRADCTSGTIERESPDRTVRSILAVAVLHGKAAIVFAMRKDRFVRMSDIDPAVAYVAYWHISDTRGRSADVRSSIGTGHRRL